MRHISKSREETKKIAEDFLNTIDMRDKACVVALQGDLGAGKTAFTQIVGELLGVRENIHSPTFVIEKIYKIDYKNFKNLIHIDAYRIDSEKELEHIGWNEIIKEPENLIFIEWPERVGGLIPSGAKRIEFKFINEETREIEVVEE